MIRIFLVFILSAGCAQHASKSQTHLEMATLWMQQAGEYRALSWQAFAAAKVSLERSLKQKRSKPAAIILDVDETVLDNSPYQARGILAGRGYDVSSWNAWVDERAAEALPGAVEFLTLAAKKGVEIFYVTNRPDQNHQATYDNLRWHGFPVKPENIQTKGDDSSKQKRRDGILEKYDVIMLVGDNLGDFDIAFYDKTSAQRRELVDERHNLWGARFIVLPNPMYGDWETALYHENEGRERTTVRRESLRTGPRKQLYYKGK